MGRRFNALNKAEQTAVVAHVRAEYDRLLFQQPTSYVSRNAEANPEGWQDGMCPLIASDPERVREIMKAAHAKRGFTLIEIAIVLVIIGLIAGAVLVGQDLIKAATVRAEATELQKVETAIYTFRDKYSALPGDISNATTFFGTIDANGYTVANGNGDGTIASTISVGGSEGNCVQGPATQFSYGASPNEVEEVFHHLNLAGMGNYAIAPPTQYAGSGLTTLPTAVLGGGMLVTCLTTTQWGFAPIYASGTGIVIGAISAPYSTRIEYALGYGATAPLLITPDMAQRLDMKMDDGQPLTGRIGVLLTCSGGAGNVLPPSTYQAMTSNCPVSMVKKLWQ